MSSIVQLPSCRDNAQNAYWNNETAKPDQSIANASLLPALLAYVIAGGIASTFNILCILTFVTKKNLREKYLLFAVLAFANLINTFFMFISGLLRRQMIFANQYTQLRSTFECLLQPGPHLQLLGGQLPAVVILLMDAERLIAVY
uniref:G-protein coupled receptors family 1 profile domain-containing protein n=1 Tax=Plectus sambesii TaxID=2011161 RepID=A0A914X3G4_9BILA